ncbi:antibiotic biosynthesis monooxygenase [Lysobacter silvisoli]|uniref:Antibiotic biosynthesis monooxygenase n=2 Tax=Lysobacter silvisoli TaxID=2293254 RepID=A0A371JXE3_9GAMM|nr:antibiotic biosynthesis monooxygenase [Lysobacter silvisoli]
MSDDRFAALPAPPYYAVIFSSQRSEQDQAGYETTAARMVELVRAQPGFLGFESTRDGSGFGITAAYFDSEASIAAWRAQAEHAAARDLGHRLWYRRFELRVARVERAYGGPHKPSTHSASSA